MRAFPASQRVKQFAQQSFDDPAFLAPSTLYPVASEAALRGMESSSSYDHLVPAVEFRHGPEFIVPEDILAGALIAEGGYAEESAVPPEMKELGGRTLAMANQLMPEVRLSADLAVLRLLPVPELAGLVVYVVWGRVLAIYLGPRKGLNRRSLRHLSRGVTLAG